MRSGTLLLDTLMCLRKYNACREQDHIECLAKWIADNVWRCGRSCSATLKGRSVAVGITPKQAPDHRGKGLGALRRVTAQRDCDRAFVWLVRPVPVYCSLRRVHGYPLLIFRHPIKHVFYFISSASLSPTYSLLLVSALDGHRLLSVASPRCAHRPRCRCPTTKRPRGVTPTPDGSRAGRGTASSSSLPSRLSSFT